MINLLVLVPQQHSDTYPTIVRTECVEVHSFQKAFPLLSLSGCETLSIIQKHPSFCLWIAETSPYKLPSCFRFDHSDKKVLIPYLVYASELDSIKADIYFYFSQNMSSHLNNSYTQVSKSKLAFEGVMCLEDAALEALLRQLPSV